MNTRRVIHGDQAKGDIEYIADLYRRHYPHMSRADDEWLMVRILTDLIHTAAAKEVHIGEIQHDANVLYNHESSVDRITLYGPLADGAEMEG